MLLRVPQLLEWLCGVVGVALFGIVAYAGLAGEQNFTSNLAPTFIYVIFWVGIPIVSALVGDLFRPFNPWRALGRLTGWLLTATRLRRRGHGGCSAPIPRGWVAGRPRRRCSAFAWLELVYPSKDDPRLLAILLLAYGGVQLAGMAAFGVETGASGPTASASTSD